ncbi:MAG: response regulator transcription factor [Chloroflexota bacterium]|nr:response regulator transcription factor [Chloroflexota bacterium]MDE3102255.1 response regulator transcription factor [Chloroflexota bacterium]
MSVRVLLVDDHFLFADALGSVIRSLPEYEVAGIAQSGAQAISLARTSRPDVILLDYHLPGYDAADLIPRLRSLSPGARIVVLTSDSSDGTLVRGLRAGVEGYLTKERALDDVLDALRVVASGGRYLTDEQLARSHAITGEGTGDALTQRELEILRLLAQGKPSDGIAGELSISENTVRTHLQNIFSKLGAHSKLEAVTTANARGLLGR